MKSVWIPVIVGVISFAVFFPLRLLTRRWLGETFQGEEFKDPCEHDWTILMEKYPTFTQDRWECRKCERVENFPHSQPPVRIVQEVCSMGHVHIARATPVESEEWPDTVGYHGWM